MALVTPGASLQTHTTGQKRSYTVPFILVTSLFFLWGLAYGFLDVLNKHFQDTLNVSKARSTLLQAAYFGAYFLIALPAGVFMERYGYKKGIILGLLLYAAGAALFYPASEMASFDFFVLALFILASGLTCLETAANPYVTILGKKETSEFRLNLSQSFNGVGAFLGPLVASTLFFGEQNPQGSLDSVKYVYLVIAAVVLVVAGMFFRTPLPEIKAEKNDDAVSGPAASLSSPHFRNSVVAQFFYVAAQVGIAALFINYCTESGNGISNSQAAVLLSVSLALFTAGRFAGTALMRIVPPNRLLAIYALANVVLCVVVVFAKGWISVYALMAIFFFESIMFPTIFALGISDLGSHTKKASSFLIMSIVGGALFPYFMGAMAGKYSTATSFIIPTICFVIVAWFGWKGYRIKKYE